MGRELKRVPLDFYWPLEKTWHGYVNFHYEKSYQCEHCTDGLSPEAKRLQDLWYGYIPFKPEDNGVEPHKWNDKFLLDFVEYQVKNCTTNFYQEYNKEYSGTDIEREAKRLCDFVNARWHYNLNQDDIDILLANDKLRDFTHKFIAGTGWVKSANPEIPTVKEINEYSFSNRDSSIYLWHLTEVKCERLGVSHLCSFCDGESRLWLSKEDELAYENWKQTPPPQGDGYQIWETTSEGSPISPVFATPEELAKHMATTRWGADSGTSYENWMKFILGPGWAPTGMSSIQTGTIFGVEGVVS